MKAGRLNNMSIAQRMRNTVTVSISGFAALVAVTAIISLLEWKFWGAQERAQNFATAILNANSDILQLRRHEKDFLLRNDPQYSEEHAAQVPVLNSHLAAASTLAPDQASADKVALMVAAVADYEAKFRALVAEKTKIGLTENMGLQAVLRDAVHKAENEVSKSNSLPILVSILQLRRHEKDFMLRGETLEAADGYLNKWNDEYQKFRALPGAAGVAVEMAEYAKAFGDLAATSKAMLGTTEAMRNAAHKTEPLTDELSALGFSVAKSGHDTLVRSATAGIVLLLLIGGVISLFASRFITRTSQRVLSPLTEMGTTIAKLAGGDTEARVNYQSKDELGDIARAFNEMMDERVAQATKLIRENEQLNNSIVALLQAAAALSQKDLTVRVPVAEDVTGAVSDAMNAMADETAKVLGQVVSVANQVALSAQEVKAQAASAMSLAGAERIAVEKSAGQLEQASASMLQVAELARQCNEAARKAIGTTETAQVTVLSTVEGINSIRETIRETEKRIKRLGERSQEISGVVSLINSIAERTHILALNASMHAASAGEAGRGFAVVANEVQRLAENARDATLKIGTLVSNIQVETADTVVTMNDAITKVVSGTALAERAGSEMKTTRDTTAELVELVQQIASQSLAQSKVTESLREQAAGIVVSSTETHDQLESQRGHTDLLVGYSDALLASVSVFTLPKREEVAPTARAAAPVKGTAKRQAANG